MKNDLHYLRALEYDFEKKPSTGTVPQPVTTISRQRGALGKVIARKTAEILTRQSQGKKPWAVIDRSLAQRVLDDHHLSQHIGRFLTDEQVASIRDRVEAVVGLQPSQWTVVEKMAQTILRLAGIGRIIIVGRAANLVTVHLPQARHVRIIGSMERRVARVMECENLSHADAQALVQKVDDNRAHFVSIFFHVNIDDSQNYDLTVNTDRISAEEAASLIAQLVAFPREHSTEGWDLSAPGSMPPA